MSIALIFNNRKKEEIIPNEWEGIIVEISPKALQTLEELKEALHQLANKKGVTGEGLKERLFQLIDQKKVIGEENEKVN